MALRDISDPKAVLQAIAEFDSLGAPAFLTKHGFKPAKQYLLAYEGKLYDSKAIAGVAHGYQFPEDGPLKASEFSGGSATVAAKLSAFGFEVIQGQGLLSGSDPSPSGRNPPWNRDELILALDAYVRWHGNPPSKTSAEIAELSDILTALRLGMGTTGLATLRNANGVYMKLMNFRAHDPVYTANGKSGLKAGNRLEEELWTEFHADPIRLARVAQAIRAGIAEGICLPTLPTTDLLDDADGAEALEGTIITRMHQTRERSRKIVNRKKAIAIQETGRLACEACGFDFLTRYGERGAGFIECHHTRPVELLGDGTPTRLIDLALLCANCHRMIHARRPWLTVADLREALR